jgi:hypothetical protein
MNNKNIFMKIPVLNQKYVDADFPFSDIEHFID